MATFTNEYDFIQARLNADKILTEKLREEEREKFTIEERAKFLHDTIAAQIRFLAQQRSEAIRNKLPTRNQMRNQMMTYLKHVKRANENFIPIGLVKDEKLIEKMNKKAAGMDKEEVAKEPESTKVEGLKENIRERSGRRLKMKASKRYPIVDWESKFYDYGHYGRELVYYRIFRADGSSRWIKTFFEMIKLFDRMDLFEIHSLVMKRFETTPPEGIDLLLWGDLRTMFESKADDELWKNQEEWKIQSWIFYENYIVHVLRLEDGTKINILVEKIYPLTKDTLKRMLDLRLTAVSDDDTVFDLLRFIEQQIDEFGGQDRIQKQMAFGKDKSNLLIVDSLLKAIRLSIHLVVYNEELAIPEQTATGKGTSNLLMAGEVQIQALVDGKKIIVNEASIRHDLKLEDAEGTACLPNATIFEKLTRMGSIMASAIICLATNKKFNFSKYIFINMVKNLENINKFWMYPRFVQVFVNQQLGYTSTHTQIFVNPSLTKKLFRNMKREGTSFSGNITPLFNTMMVQASEEVGEDSELLTDSNQIPIDNQPSISSQPQKKQKSKRKQKKEAEVPQDETHHKESIPITSNDPLPSGEDRMQLTELMILCTNLQEQVLDLETSKATQAKEIVGLKKRVKKLERRQKSRTIGLKRLRKVGETRRVESSENKDSLGAQEDASKQGRKIKDLDADA
ncbi:hypothetical protein Tco_0632389 [Tanacetum coccineum]